MEPAQLPRRTTCLVRLLVFCMQLNIIWSMAIRGLKLPSIKRQSNIMGSAGQLECIHMESLPGDYWYQSSGGSDVCGLFIIGSTDHLIEVDFVNFDVSCEMGGLLATLDGWETRGQIYPSSDDHTLSMQQRYTTYCGENAPTRTTFITSQNVGLIQFRIPRAGDGFRINIRFIKNEQPCNVVSMESDGAYTLRNYGERMNCSASFLYPETIAVLDLDVGVTLEAPRQTRESGALLKCSSRGSGDYVQILAGEGLDPKLMYVASDFCGLESMPGILTHTACSNSVVRLVSTGDYFNSITFGHAMLTSLHQTDGVLFTQCY